MARPKDSTVFTEGFLWKNGWQDMKRDRKTRSILKFKPGDIVRVVGSRGTAKIRAILSSMHGALLERAIGGFRRWNQDELRLVKRGKAK
jgi:hypothetical protein